MHRENPAIQASPIHFRPFSSFSRILSRALLGSGVVFSALSGSAMAVPGIPAAPVIIWSEDFENPQVPPILAGGDGRDLLVYKGATPPGADVYRRSALPHERQPVQWHRHVIQPESQFGGDGYGLRSPKQFQ